MATRRPTAEPRERVGGRLVLEHLLASGGFAEVYRARDADTGEPRAVKWLHRVDERATRDLEREARALATLSGPGLVRLLGKGVHQGRGYLELQLVEGPALTRGLWERAGAPGERPFGERWPAVHDAFAVLVDTLRRVHSAGIVHRDLKPSNILLGRGGPVLLDLGLARGVDGSLQRSLSGVVGTPGYMAPELIAGTRVTPAADLFALGVLLYEALTGALPYSTDLGLALLEVRRGPPAMPAVPAALQGLIRQLLHPAADHRPHHDEVLRGLAGDDRSTDGAHQLPWLGSRTLREALADPPTVGVWSVQGGAGAGKSRALREVERALRRSGFTVHARRMTPNGALRADLAPWGAVPEATAAPTGLAALRARGRARAATWASDFASDLKGPTALLVDDLHAASSVSVAALSQLVERSARVLLVTAGTRAPLWVAARSFALGPLDADAVGELFVDDPAQFVDARSLVLALRAACHGQPDLLADAVARAEQLRLIAPTEEGRWRVLATAGSDVQALLASDPGPQLSPEENGLLDLVLALGGVVPLEVLVAVSDTPADRLVDALQVLVQGEHCLESPDGMLRARVPDAQRPLLPAQVAVSALRALDRSVRELGAVGLLRGVCHRALGRHDDALEAWADGAAHAAAHGGHETVLRIAGLCREEPADRARVGTLRLEAARSCMALGRLQDARGWVEGVPGPDADLARWELAHLSPTRQDAPEQGFASLEHRGPLSARAQAAYQLGRLQVSTGRAAQGCEALRAAAALWRELGDDAGRIRAEGALAFALLADGYPLRALGVLEAIFGALGEEDEAYGRIANQRASVLFAVGRADESLEVRDRAVRAFRGRRALLHLAEALASVVHTRARLRRPLGDEVEEVLSFTDRFSLADARCNLLRALADEALDRGAPEACLRFANEMLELARPRQRRILCLFAECYRAAALAALRDAEGFRLAAASLESEVPTASRFNLAWEVPACLARAATALGAVAAPWTTRAEQQLQAYLTCLRADAGPNPTAVLEGVWDGPGALVGVSSVLSRSEVDRVWALGGHDRPEEPGA